MKFFFQSLREIQARSISWNMKHFHGILCNMFLFFINHKNCVYRKRCFLDKQYLLLVKQKQKKSRKTRCIWMEPWLKNRRDRSACANIFPELLLNDKLQHFKFKWMLHPAIDYTLVFTYWRFYITYTYTYFIMYWFLHINIFILLTLALLSSCIDFYTLTFLYYLHL